MIEELYIKRILKGETEAFCHFVSEYKDVAYSLAASVVKDEFTTTDVVQEAYIKAFENLKSFKGNSKFSTWFFIIVINEAFKFLKKNQIKFPEYNLEVTDSAKDELENADRAFYVNEILQQKSPSESLSLRLFYLSENSLKEICEITGWSESKTKVTLHRARKTMEEKLKRLLNHEAKSLL